MCKDKHSILMNKIFSFFFHISGVQPKRRHFFWYFLDKVVPLHPISTIRVPDYLVKTGVYQTTTLKTSECLTNLVKNKNK